MTTINYSISSSFRPLCTTPGAGTAAQPSPNEVKFDEVVRALLKENHAHRDLKKRLRQLVVEESQKLPPIKVVFCTSFGGFRFSKEFEAFLDSRSIRNYDSNRSDPALIQAISDYGRSICDKFPFILDEMKAVDTWKLDKVLAKLRQEFCRDPEVTEFNPDLVAEATSFIEQMCDSGGRWKKGDCLGTFPDGKGSIYGDEPEVSFMAFTEMHPDFWMAHYSVKSDTICGSSTTFKVSFRFARVLLQGDKRARYRVLSDEAQDAGIYERIGLFGATSTLSCLAIEEVPALVDYSIDEYDGQESVNYES